MPEYSHCNKLQLEKYWSEKISYLAKLQDNGDKKKIYILSMFPYPSGQLHMGHMRVYTTADVLARYYNLLNRNVIFPMGWDSFGLPAENAAFERHLEPKVWTDKNINEMREQMKEQMSLSIDWKTELSTSNPKYFKWTQWLFCRLYENGLVYQKSDMVNWDPVDNTVLADELIDKEGKSWRSGAVAIKIPLKQWFIRTTALSKSLIDGLDIIKGGQWRHVIKAQKGWLGNLDGVYIDFDLVDMRDGQKFVEKLPIFTSRPVTALTDFVAFVEINTDNVWWKYAMDDNQSTVIEYPSFHSHLAVKHPLSGRLIPLLRNPHLKFNEEECLSARMGFPLINLNDAKLAAKLDIPLSSIKLGAYNTIKGSALPPSEGQVLDDNLESKLEEQSLQTLRNVGRGGYKCSKLRTDWLISRQRYWGTPIPIIHCPSCGPVLVEDNKLPVELPPFTQCQSNESVGNIASPLAKASDWLKVDCPKCGNIEAKRETDTMDTFVDSSWYFLRYLDVNNSSQLCSPQIAHSNMPVDIYIGGLEHSLRHLFYARFISHFIHYYTEIKLPDGPEPFSQFLPVGLILGQTYKTKTGRFVPTDKVIFQDNKALEKDTNEPLMEYWDKMSKSKHNGISPKSVVDKYGIDLTRIIMMSNTGPDKDRKWQETDIVQGAQTWEKRMWKLIKDAVENPGKEFNDDFLIKDESFISEYKSIINKIQFNYSQTFTISAVIASLHKLTKLIMKQSVNENCKHSILYHRILLDYLLYLYPISPLLSSELWAQLSQTLLPVESIFITTNSTYSSYLGEWSYDLSQPICYQKLYEDKSAEKLKKVKIS